MIAVIDYGVGNLFSLTSSLAYLGAEAQISTTREQLQQADKIILPGVGAFGDAAIKLRQSGLEDTVKEQAAAGKPLLGICLGMQLLFEKSYEYGEHDGLGLIKGGIYPLTPDLKAAGFDYKVPQMGWNDLKIVAPDCPLLKYSKTGEYVYFVHSYYAKNCEESLAATCNYGVEVPALVYSGNVFGAQFHPEKSGAVGLKILQAFIDM